MVFEHIESLKLQFTDKYVVVDGTRPELRRFARLTGRVRTVNMNGRALVEFDGNSNIAWYDIDPCYLKVVDAPPPVAEVAEKKPAKPAAAKAERAADATVAGKPAASQPAAGKAPAAKGAAAASGMSVADILAQARGGAASASAKGPTPPTPKSDTPVAKAKPASEAKGAGAAAPTADVKKMSVSEILAAARGKAVADKVEPPAPQVEAKPTVSSAKGVAKEAPSSKAEVPTPPKATSGGAKSNLPQATADIVDWCRKHDGK
ncbi:MAG: hypothetical protein O2931_06475 [Planctomycetota bacterium]|nr:hypothetical protein [Planctomycetota bacterium]MDA1178424.1 hypothetical protein [Planctomycetota bacterium]